MAMDNYKHVIEVQEATGKLVIYRQYENGRTELYTEVKLTEHAVLEGGDSLTGFARLLGENILMDSPAARKLLGL